MSATSHHQSGISLTVNTLVTSLLFAGILAVLTSPILTNISTESGRMFAAAALLGFSVTLAHSWIVGDGGAETDRIAVAILAVVLSFAVYNGILFVAIVAGTIAESVTGSIVAGVLVATLWPAWEIASMQRALPVSLSGILVWVLAVVYVFVQAGKAVFQVIAESSWDDWIERVSEVGEHLETEPLRFISSRGFRRVR